MNVVQTSARTLLRYSRPRVRSLPVASGTVSTFNYASFAPRPTGGRWQERQQRQPQSLVRSGGEYYRQDRRRKVADKPREIATTWKASSLRKYPGAVPLADHPGFMLQGCGLPPRLVERLNAVLPLAKEPTPAQAEFLSAVLLGKRDVFLKEDTGRGKSVHRHFPLGVSPVYVSVDP